MLHLGVIGSLINVNKFFIQQVPTTINYITNGLIGWYKFAEGTGTSSTADSSPSNYSGSLIGSPTWVSGVPSDSVSPYALKFNGTSQYVVANQQTISGSFSVCCWCNFITIGSNYPMLVALGNVSDYSIQNYSIFLDFSDSNEFAFQYRNGSLNDRLDSGVVPSLNTWYHVCVTCNITSTPNTNIIFYINGNNIASTNYADNPGTIAPQVFNIGCYGDTTSFCANAIISDVRIYNRVLSSTEVSKIYNLQG